MTKQRFWISTTAVLIVLSIVSVLLLRHTTEAPVNRSRNQPTKNLTSKPTTTNQDFDRSRFSTTDPISPWVVVNKQHPLQPIDYAPTDLTAVGNNQVMRAEAANQLNALFASAKQAGYTLIAASAYRSYQTQVRVYDSEVTSYGQTQADSESARPGYSEHQTGWAIDIGGGGCNIDDCFANTAEGKWTDANAYKFGFILRYTPADTTLTGYRAEAWHFRYVGTYLATYMHDHNLATLEQLFDVSGGADYKS